MAETSGIGAAASEAGRATVALAKLTGEASRKIVSAVDNAFKAISYALRVLMVYVVLIFCSAFISQWTAHWGVPLLTLGMLGRCLYLLSDKIILEVFTVVVATEELIDAHEKLTQDARVEIIKKKGEALNRLGLAVMVALYLMFVPIQNDRLLALGLAMMCMAIVFLTRGRLRFGLFIAALLITGIFFLGGRDGVDERAMRHLGFTIFDRETLDPPKAVGYDRFRRCMSEKPDLNLFGRNWPGSIYYRSVVGCNALIVLPGPGWGIQTWHRENPKKDWISISCPDGRILALPRQPSQIRLQDLACGKRDIPSGSTFLIQGNVDLAFIPPRMETQKVEKRGLFDFLNQSPGKTSAPSSPAAQQVVTPPPVEPTKSTTTEEDDISKELAARTSPSTTQTESTAPDDKPRTQPVLIEDSIHVPCESTSRKRGVRGTAKVSVDIDDLGNVNNPRIVTPETPSIHFMHAILHAVRQFKFKPGTDHNGNPTQIRTYVDVTIDCQDQGK